MRIRSIRPEFWSSEDIASLSWDYRLIYIGLWSYVDDNGVGRDVEKLIAADLFPLDDDPHGVRTKIAGALSEYSSRQMVTRYTVDGKPFLHVSAWEKHQKINRPSEGRYPLPTREDAVIQDTLTEPSVSPPANVPLGEGEKGRRGEGEKASRKRSTPTPIPDDFQPSPANIKYAEEQGLDLDHELAQFVNNSVAKGNTFKDWHAAFRTWLGNSKAWGRRPVPRPSQGSGLSNDELFGMLR